MKHDDGELLETLGPIIRDAGIRRFEPGFASRVIERIRAEDTRPVIVLSAALGLQFFRLAPLAAGLILALSAYSLLGTGISAGQSFMEATFGLEPVTLEAVYAFDQILDPANE
jgi:hypothetical protein